MSNQLNKYGEKKMKDKEKVETILEVIENDLGIDFFENYGQYDIEKFEKMKIEIQKIIE